MTTTVVYGFAVEDDLVPVPGAAPYPVLSRQLPRLLVTRLNAGGDRGARFFPFIGKEEGTRRFLELKEQLPPETLVRLHGQDPPRCLVDGMLREHSLNVRILEGESGAVRFEEHLAFDPARPLEALQRVLFEVTGMLEWPGRPPELPALEGEALAWFLVGKDDLLSLEADIERDPEEALRAARKCLEMEPGKAEVRDLLLEICARLVRKGAALDTVADVLWEACTRIGSDGDRFQAGAARVLEACGRRNKAAEVFTRLARRHPADPAFAERAAALHFELGHLEPARGILLAAREHGVADVSMVAQLAAIHDRLGDREARDLLCEELLRCSDRPVVVSRLLASYLLERQRAEEALAVVDSALEIEPGSAALRLERGRALLLLERGEEANESLRACLASEPPPGLAAEAERLMQFAEVPDLLQTMQRVEDCLRRGDARGALGPVRRLLRRHRDRAEPWLLLGIAHQRLRHQWRAERALRRAVALDPELAEAHNRLGILLVGRGRPRDGIAHLERALAGLPGEPSPHLHMAQACFLLGRPADAQRHLSEAERLGADPETVAMVRREFSEQGS